MTARLAALLEPIEGALVLRGDPGSVDVTSVTQDSAAVRPGSLYCCIVGSRVDAHELAGEVVAAGARSLLVEHLVPVAADVAQVRVPSTRRAIGPVAAGFWGHPSRRLAVVGVTGTNGKTTTTHLLASILEAAGRRAGLIGTLSGRRTTPEAALLQEALAGFADAGCAAVAMEVSSMALDQRRVDGIEFAVGVWTNLSQDHLDYHHDMESYFAAKAMLFDPDRCRLAIVNRDDPWGSRLLDRLSIPARTYGLEDAVDAEIGAGASRFRWRGEDVELPMGGTHNVANALAAASAAEALGVGPREVADGLRRAPVVPGRWEVVDAGQGFGVVVDYAHTPDGLENVLGSARATLAQGARLIVVFGCGGDRDRAKRPLMAGVATRIADLAVLTSDNPRSEDPAAIIADAAAGADPAGRLLVEADREKAISLALDDARPGDLVVIAGKGHETGQIVGDRVLPFDDRVVARRLLGGR